MKKVFLLSLLFAAYFLALSRIYAVETQVVAGPRISAAIAGLFFQELSKLPETQDYQFKVSIEATQQDDGIHNSHQYLFRRTARPLGDEEKQVNEEEIVLARIPVVIAVGTDAGVSSLSADQLWKICSGQATNWKDLGGRDAPIKLVGGTSAQTLCVALGAKYPVLGGTEFSRIFESAAQLSDFLVSAAGRGALALGTTLEFERMRDDHFLTIEDLDLGIYVGLVYHRLNKDHQLVQTVRNLAKSRLWADLAANAGFLPPDTSGREHTAEGRGRMVEDREQKTGDRAGQAHGQRSTVAETAI